MSGEPHNPHSSVVPVTSIEGYGYTLLVASPGNEPFRDKARWCASMADTIASKAATVLFINVDGYSGNKLGSSRAAHWMLLGIGF